MINMKKYLVVVSTVYDGSSWLMIVDNDTHIYIYIYLQYIPGGWLSPTLLKYLKVSWDDDITKI